MSRVVCLLSLAGFVVGQSQCVSVTHGTGAQAGDGVHRAQPGDTVTINYAGYLTNGAKFDSSYDRGKPFTTQIGVGQVIQGWDQGVPQLSLGETATLYISASCGYGAQGAPPSIPANSDLIFNVDLLSINGKSASSPTPAPFQAQAWAAPASQPFQQPSFSGGASFSGSAQPSFSAAQPSFSAGASFSGSADSFGAQPSTEGSGDAAGVVLGGPLQNWFPTPAPAPTVAHVGLPSCIQQTCGRAISGDPNSLGTPLCLCNPLCQTMAGTPGVLPCCPGLQEVCLDPWRSPTLPSPTPAPQAAWPQASTQAFHTSQPVQTVQSQPAQPVQHPAAQFAQQPAQQPVQHPAQQPVQQPVQQPAQQPVQQPMQQPMQDAQPSQPAAGVITATAIPLSAAPATAPAALVTHLTPGVCAFGSTKWSAKKTCADKRWTIREGKCKKSCDAAAPNAKAQYWPKTQAGQDACKKALTTCPK